MPVTHYFGYSGTNPMLTSFLKYHTSGFLCLLHGSPHGIRA